jgi:predicted PurR-regulated permease PerM
MHNLEPLTNIQKKLSISALICLLVFLAFIIVNFFADIFRILGIAILLSYLFINAVDLFEKIVRNRALAIVLLYTLLLAIIIFGLFWVAPMVFYQISQLINTTFNELPDLLQRITQSLTPIESRFRAYQIEIKAADILTNIIQNIPKPDPSVLIMRISDMAMSTMTWLVYAISIAVVTFYFLLDGHNIKESIISLFPNKHRNLLNLIAQDMDKSMQAFFKGQIVLGILMGLVMLIVYMALGIQYALLLSIFLAIWEILPVVGPPIGFLPAIITIAIHGSNLPGNAFIQIVAVTIIFTVLQQIKDSIIAPKYMGNVIGLHPILIFVAIMIGARLDGMLGIIFSLPAACFINVMVNHLRLAYVQTNKNHIEENLI